MSLAAELDEIWAAEVNFVPEDKRVITDAAYKKLVGFGVMNGVIKVADSLPCVRCPTPLTKPPNLPNTLPQDKLF